MLNAIGEELPCITYDTWRCCLPEGDFDTAVGADQFCDVLAKLRGIRRLPNGATSNDSWNPSQRPRSPFHRLHCALTGELFYRWPVCTLIHSAFSECAQANWTVQPDYEFCRSGFIHSQLVGYAVLPALRASCRWHQRSRSCLYVCRLVPIGVTLDYPIGGSAALVDALVRGLKRHGGTMMLNAHVNQVLIDNQRAIGVQLKMESSSMPVGLLYQMLLHGTHPICCQRTCSWKMAGPNASKRQSVPALCISTWELTLKDFPLIYPVTPLW